MIEVLLAMAVTMTVLIAVLGMFNSALRVFADSRNLTTATNLASKKLAEFKSEPLANIVTGSDSVDRYGMPYVSGGVQYNREWDVSNIDVDGDGNDDLVGDLVKVKLDVNWTAARRDHQVTMALLTTGRP